MKRLEKIPVPLLPTMVGALTLGNVYAGMGYTAIRHLTMVAGTIILLLYLVKIICFPKTCRQEYENTVPASLYAGFTMMLMILGSYYYEFIPVFGKTIWAIAICIHAIHICIFTYRNVIKKRDINTFVPSWFVTYNGIMVSCVVGSGMNANSILQYIVYYGIIIYIILIPMMIWRLLTVEVKPAVYHTMAVVLAPCSLCVVSYLNIVQEPNQILLYFLYICVLASVIFIVCKLPKFFDFAFTPAYAGLTFPMAIGCVASSKMSAYLAGMGQEALSGVVKQIGGIQIYVTTMIIGYVLLQLIRMLCGKNRGV